MPARAYDRILKVARTIADLDGSKQIKAYADSNQSFKFVGNSMKWVNEFVETNDLSKVN